MWRNSPAIVNEIAVVSAMARLQEARSLKLNFHFPLKASCYGRILPNIWDVGVEDRRTLVAP